MAGIQTHSKLLWFSLLSARMKKIYSKIKARELSLHFSNCKSMGIFSDVQGLLTPQSEMIRACMAVFLTCKNEEDPIKYESARVVTTLYIHFSDV